jgi:hypothetical protein
VSERNLKDLASIPGFVNYYATYLFGFFIYKMGKRFLASLTSQNYSETGKRS